MKDSPKGSSQILGWGCALLFIISLPFGLLLFNAGRVLYDPPLMKEILTEITIESDLVPAGLSWYSTIRARERYVSGQAEAWVDEPNLVDLIEFIEFSGWRTIRWEVLTNDILTDWVSTSVDDVYAWIDSDQPVPEIVLDLTKFRQRVASDHGLQAIMIAYQALPPCTEEQINDFKGRLASASAGTEVLYNLCSFPDPWYEDQFLNYLDSLEDLAANTPSTINLIGQLPRTMDIPSAGAETIKQPLRFSRQIVWAALVTPAVFLILLASLVVRSWGDIGRWLGVPLAIGGTFTALPALFHRSIVIRMLSLSTINKIPPIVQNEVTEAILRFAKEIFEPMLWASLVILPISLVLILIGSLVESRGESAREG